MQTDLIIYIAFQILVILTLAPLVNGVIKKLKAFSQKRKGAPVFQMYFDLFKLFRKGTLVSETSSWIFKAAPFILFSTSLTAALLVPVSTLIPEPLNLPGDFIMMVSIFALGRFFMMLAGLDTGSTFGGMGSSREAMISSLIEPAILVSLFTAALITGSTSLSRIMSTVNEPGSQLPLQVSVLLFPALLIIILAETARIPVDDPSTHLELTMVHEAMILEYSGRHLALIEYGAAIKQLTLITLMVNILIPHDQIFSVAAPSSLLLSLLVYIGKVFLSAVLIALIEINTVKLKLFSIPNLAALAFILSFIAFLQYFVLGGIYVRLI